LELEAGQRKSFWPNLIQNFLMNFVFFVLGVVATLLTTQPH
jgi:hypothetical protein